MGCSSLRFCHSSCSNTSCLVLFQGLRPVLVADLACLQQDAFLCQPVVTCAQLVCTAGSVLLVQWQCTAGRAGPASLLHLQLGWGGSDTTGYCAALVMHVVACLQQLPPLCSACRAFWRLNTIWKPIGRGSPRSLAFLYTHT
jgi:hypothetical protein